MSLSEGSESIKSRLMHAAKALKVEYCSNVFDPTELAHESALSLTLGDPFASELSEILKHGGLELLRTMIEEFPHKPGAARPMPEWSQVQEVIRYQVWPIVLQVWVEAEGLQQNAITRHHADRESEILPGVWQALIDAARQIYELNPSAQHAPDASYRPTDAPQDSGSRNRFGIFPHRAEWLKCELKARGWNKHRVAEFGGPNHKTVQKILDGKRVQEGVLEALVDALTKKQPLSQAMPID